MIAGMGRRLQRAIGLTRTVSTAKLEAMYARNPDPWGLARAGNDYERDKFIDTVALLPRPRYERALEVGCSVGALTSHLAGRCVSLLGVDLSEVALTEARARNRAQPHVAFARHHLPDDSPAGKFDLIVFSEVLYFFNARDLRQIADWTAGATTTGANLLLVNYLGPLHDYPLTGDQAATSFLKETAAWAEPIRCERRAQYRVDVLRRR